MAYGSGTLYLRGKIWYYQAYVNGKQIGPKSARTTDRRKAQLELDKLIGQRARGEVVSARSGYETVSDVIEQYKAYARERLKSADIICAVLDAHVAPKLGSLRLANCNVDRLRKYRKLRQSEGADATTCNRELSYLRAAWRRPLKEGMVSSIPYFPITKEDNARGGFLEERDFLRFLRELPEYLRGFAVCAYYGGMRRSEILRLQPTDVDVERGFLEIRQSKNDDPRAVPIFDGPMLEWLRWSLEHCSPSCLFVRPDGRAVTKRNFYTDWHKAASRAKVTGFIPHDSRRSASRNMRNEGIPQSVRMKVMGQRTPSMDRRYGIVDLADVDLVREKMNRRTTTETTTQSRFRFG